MMSQISVNYWAVLVAAIANMVIGMLWYSKAVFGSAWMQLIGMTEKKMKEAHKKGMAARMIVMFISALVIAYVTAHFVAYAGAVDIMGGLELGFWLWLGYVATIMLGIVLWEGKPVKLYVINAGYWLVTLLIMSSILAVWQ